MGSIFGGKKEKSLCLPDVLFHRLVREHKMDVTTKWLTAVEFTHAILLCPSAQANCHPAKKKIKRLFAVKHNFKLVCMDHPFFAFVFSRVSVGRFALLIFFHFMENESSDSFCFPAVIRLILYV